MRYFKDKNENRWAWDGSRMWAKSIHDIPEQLTETDPNIYETDAAGNPLGKYRYFRDKNHPKCEWRFQESVPSWEIRNYAIRSDWIPSSFYTPAGFLSGDGAYECDEQGGRLAAKEEDNKPLNWKPIRPESSPTPMSEEDRFRWQVAGQAMVAIVAKHPPMTSTKAEAREIFEQTARGAIWQTDLLIAELKKPKATGTSNG